MNEMIEKNKINRFRLLKNGLVKKFPDITSCLFSLNGIQAQILSASYLSIFNRVENIKSEDIDKALTLDHSIIRVWAYRSTLHLINSCNWDLISSALIEDHSWFKDKINKSNCRDEYLEISHDIRDFISKHVIFSRSDLKVCFKNPDKYDFYISSWGGLLIDLSQKGFICHAPINKKINFVSRSNWLPNLKFNSFDLVQANITLLRNYIKSYGPVEVGDFAFWRGINKSQAAEYFNLISDELYKICYNNKIYYISKKDKYIYSNFDDTHNSILLLYKFDPILLAYKDKFNMIDPMNYKNIWQIAGHIEGVILNSGFIIGRWNYKKTKPDIIFQYDFFYKVSDSIIEQVVNKSLDIIKFLGASGFKYYMTNSNKESHVSG